MDVEGGKTRRETHPLYTDNKRMARLKLAQIRKSLPTAPKVRVQKATAYTVRELCELVMSGQTIKDMPARKARMSRFVYPIIGDRLASSIKPHHITEVLEAMRDQGYAKATIIHIKWDLSAIWDDARYGELIPRGTGSIPSEAEARVPEDAVQETRERAVLSDRELGVYLAFRHRNHKLDRYVLERQVLCCLSRLFGGLRTSEMLALTWDDLIREDETFRYGGPSARRFHGFSSWRSR